MHFIPEIHAKNVDATVRECVAIAGQDRWEWRKQWMIQQIQQNPLLAEFIAERYPVELAYVSYVSAGTQLRTKAEQDPAAIRKLAIFAAAIVEVNRRLTPFGQNQLRGKLVHGLTRDDGLASLMHELATAVHLMGRGFDVTFHDLENNGGFDLLATRDQGVEVEVECKLASSDLGRGVHRRRALDLFNTLKPAITSLMKDFRGGCCYRLFVPLHLGADVRQHAAILDALKYTILTGKDVFEGDACTIYRSDFSLSENPFENIDEMPDQHSMHAFVKKRLRIANQHCMFIGSKKSKCIVVSAESRRLDNMLDSVFRTLRDAAKKQCTGKRPAILCTRFYDLGASELAQLGDVPLGVLRSSPG